MTNTIFLELSERQVNTFNLRRGSIRETLIFDRDHRRRPLDIGPGS